MTNIVLALVFHLLTTSKMARVYQSKKVIGYQRPNIEPHEEDTLHEPKGMSFPAVPFNFTAQSNTYLFQNNLHRIHL